MVEKIGKVVVIASLVVGTLCADAAVSLRVTDTNGNQLLQAQVGVPFLVSVRVSGDTQPLPKSFVEGLDAFELQGSSSGSQTVSINGKVTLTKTENSIVVPRHEGTFTIGPAKIVDKGNTLSSETVLLSVGKKQKSVEGQESEKVLLTMSIDKDSVYQGQAVGFKLRFYYSDNDIRLGSINEPNFKTDFFATKLEGPASGIETIEEKQYRYLEWTSTLYPEKSGTLKIAPLEGVYTESIQSGMFGGMSGFFGMMRDQKSVYSNELSFQAKPLPPYEVPVKAVGNFSRAVLRVATKKAQQQEGVVAFLDLYGTGNMGQISHPPLVLPEGLTMYESSTDITQNGSEHKKTWEYVIQGQQPGDYTIESQTVVFFDPIHEQYKTLVTSPVNLTIVPGAVTKQDVPPSLISQKVDTDPSSFALITTGAWKERKENSLSWWIIYGATLLSLMSIAGRFVWQWYKVHKAAQAPHVRYRQAFKKARISFENARNRGYVGHVYHIFIELFAARFYKERSEITEESMEDILLQKGVSQAEIVQWRLVLAHLAQYAFAYHGNENEHNNKVFSQAAYWLNKLETLL